MYVPVPSQVELVVGKNRGTAGTVGKYIVTLVKKALFPEGLHHPPDGFHIIRIHGLVIVIKVHPSAQSRNNMTPLFYITQHRGTAGFVEFGYSEFFYIRLGIKSQFRFYKIFYRQPVTVPAETAFYLHALHGLVTGNNVLYGIRYKMTKMGQPRGERRAVIKNILFFSPALGN
jgi:hypothetical protein